MKKPDPKHKELIKKFIEGNMSFAEEQTIIELYRTDIEFKKHFDRILNLKNQIDDMFPDDDNKDDEITFRSQSN